MTDKGTTMTTQKGLLLRVGIDQTFGEYNAPINPDNNDYLYMPIPQYDISSFREDCVTSYANIKQPFQTWCERNNILNFPFPNHRIGENNQCLIDSGTHLDPDFSYLSYGDQGTGRGNRVIQLQENDFIVFFASFKPTKKCKHNLIYAIFGIFFVDNVIKAYEIPDTDLHKNAHTRVKDINKEHLVVFGKKGNSGRLKHAIPIGEYRNRSYRVTEELLDSWGGLGVNDGYIQRSVTPPWFCNPEKFLGWLNKKNIQLLNNNW